MIAIRRRSTLATRQRSWQSKEALWGYIFVTPALVGFLVFTLIPVVTSFYLSLTDYDGISPNPNFIGAQNYQNLLQDSDFLNSLVHTVYFTLGAVPLGAFLSLLVAVALNTKSRLTAVYRAAFFLPVITSLVAATEVWKWLYNPSFGLIDSILGGLHLYQPPWLTSTAWAMPAIITMSIWKGLGFSAIIFLAGLQGISPSLYEAAKIDGASAIQRFFYITIPLLRHSTLFVLVISLIGSCEVLDKVYLMTAGGPAQSTNVVVYWIYENAFQFFKQGYASAMAYVLFVIIFAATLIQMKISQHREVA